MESNNKTILVTGATGYIGSHTVTDLLKKKYKVVMMDNTCNSSPKVIEHICKLTNTKKSDIPFYNLDIRNSGDFDHLFEDCKSKGICIDAVIHFAALKSVGMSVDYPLDYYQTNLFGTMNLLAAMKKYACHRLIFSSSACVYGNGNKFCSETDSTETLNPYGSTKLFSEKLIKEFCDSKSGNHCLSELLYKVFNYVYSLI